jgi:putative membrane protein
MQGMSEFLRLLLGTVIYRPYVYGFFVCFLFFSLKQLKARGTLLYLILSYFVAYASEWSATRNGFPFGMYVYLDETRTRELWLSNIPFWDSLSFVFLSYFSWNAASSIIGKQKPAEALFRMDTAILGGLLMMLLDVVIDPLTVLGDRWFLGKIYYYPDGGTYFGVTISNFLGWWFVGTITILFAQRIFRWGEGFLGPLQALTRLEHWGIWGVYAGVMLFNLMMTAWIQEWPLFATSLLVVFGTLLIGIKRFKATHFN